MAREPGMDNLVAAWSAIGCSDQPRRFGNLFQVLTAAFRRGH
jgi:hypothetical protein